MHGVLKLRCHKTPRHCSEKYSARFPPLNGRVHVMVLTFCLQPKGPRCVGHVWQHPSNLLVLRSPVPTPQKRSYFSLAHLGLPRQFEIRMCHNHLDLLVMSADRPMTRSFAQLRRFHHSTDCVCALHAHTFSTKTGSVLTISATGVSTAVGI